jgi:2'-5' RNA ligase
VDEARRAWRLFIALPLPDAAIAAATASLRPLRARFPSARWIGADALHVTLVFLASTDPVQAGAIAGAIDSAAHGRSPIEILLGGGGGRERGQDDGVAWLSLARGAAEAVALARELSEALLPLNTGDRGGPRRSPSAHVTVARRAPATLLRDPLFVRAADPPIGWRAGQVVLFRSFLERNGARYEALHAAPLVG